MMNFFTIAAGIYLSFYNSLEAKSLQKACHNLGNCIKEVSELTGVKYFFNANELKGGMAASENFELTKENADGLLSTILNENGYTRILQKDNSYHIIRSSDVRYNPIPKIQVSFDKSPVLPDNMDYFMMEYTLKNNKAASSYIVRSLRPFASRYGRVIELQTSGVILVQDTAKNLARFYEIIKTMDVRPSKEVLAQWKKEEEQKFEIQKIEAKNCAVKNEEVRAVDKKN